MNHGRSMDDDVTRLEVGPEPTEASLFRQTPKVVRDRPRIPRSVRDAEERGLQLRQVYRLRSFQVNQAACFQGTVAERHPHRDGLSGLCVQVVRIHMRTRGGLAIAVEMAERATTQLLDGASNEGFRQ